MKKICIFTVCMACMFLIATSSGRAEELRILCWEGYAPPEYTEPFEKLVKERYGVELNVRVTNVSDPQEFFDGIRGKGVDLISPAHNIPKSERWPYIAKKLVLPLNLDNIPHYNELIAELQHAEYISEDGQVYGVPIVYGPYGLAYNTSIVKEAPESWEIFWNPEYAGQYAISADYHEANIYSTALAAGIHKEEVFAYDNVHTPEIQQKLRTLSQNAKTFWVGVDTADDLQGLAFATAWGFALPELAQRGEVWKMAQPKEGTTGWVDNWMIGYSLKDNPQMKEIAEAWIDYTISPEIQRQYVRDIAQFPVNPATAALLSPEENDTFHVNDPTYFKDNLILWKVLGRKDQAGFRRMWEKAKQE